VVTIVAWLMLAAPAAAQVNGPTLPANDLEALLAGGQQSAMEHVETLSGPKLAPVPRADCGPGSHPLAGEQGRVPATAVDSAAADRGWTCNLEQIGHLATPGGFRVWRYTDPHGHVCAFYDTSLSSPANVVSLAGGPSPGVEVLDVSDPAHPRETDLLTTPAMLAPHESLNLNYQRGLLGAEVGNGLTLPGELALYDVAQDCRHPVLDSELATKTGHESGFTQDGKTFWVAGGAGYIDAVDVSDPHHPNIVWEGAYYSHGLNLSDDGRTLYQTDPINGNLGIFDVSQVQERRPAPQVSELSRVTWDTVSIPQNTVPLTISGRRYLLEFDEFAFRFNPATIDDRAGAARLIDITDPAHPKLTSDLRLEVNMRAAHQVADSDPSALPGEAFVYGAHYCAAPREVDPGIVACSFLNSGLRVFDVRRPAHPRETAYFVAPPKAGTVAGYGTGDDAFSQPAFDPSTREVFYTDATSGFYALKLDARAWPRAARTRPPVVRCASRRAIVVHFHGRPAVSHVRVRVDGRPVAARRVGRRGVRVDLRGRPKGRFTVVVTATARGGEHLRTVRRYRTCTAKTG
jgi:hypothetical protein